MMATGPYVKFLPNLLASMKEHFLTNHDVHVHVFTDQVEHVITEFQVEAHFIQHDPNKKWYPTVDRFNIFRKYYGELDGYDNYVYIDSDSLITDTVDDELLGERVYVQHCGFLHKMGTYDRNPLSSCYVEDGWEKLQHQLKECQDVDEKLKLRKIEKNFVRPTYVAGSIWSFSRDEFWRFIDTACDMLASDLERRILPLWADESIINRYALDNPPTTLLNPSYHYPQKDIIRDDCWTDEDKVSYPCKILQLQKALYI